MFDFNPPSNKYWVPYIYARPKYIIIATPFGSRHVPLPLEDFLVAVILTLLVVLATLYLFVPRRYLRRFCCCCCCCSCFNQQNKRRATKPRPVLIITDIGRDIDDTLALCTLNGLRKQGKVKIVGVVATGGNGLTRARVVRFWLRRFDISDTSVPVAACMKDGRTECFIPKGTPSLESAALYVGTAAELILDCATTYPQQLEIFALAPLTPLADALEMKDGLAQLTSGVRILHIQGQSILHEQEQLIYPDFAAFNLREDQEASNNVFAALQSVVPFRMLGKHAAYQVSLTRSDFSNWDTMTGTKEMTLGAKNNMNIFRTGNPTKFYQLYPIPEEHRNDDDWFDHMQEFSHPYDPLCLLAGFYPKLFHAKKIVSFHRAIGNTNDSLGVVDAEKTRLLLSKLIGDGVRGV